MLFKLILILVVLRGTRAVIYSMNESEYNRMPPLYALDDFDSCMAEPAGTYCVLDADLHSNTGSQLMRIIRAYSEHKQKHFNHTQIHRGICVTKTCKNYLGKYDNTTWDINVALGECLNDSLWGQYGIEASVADVQYCKKEGDTMQIDTGDIIVAVVYFIIIILNAIGSLYDILLYEKDDKSGNAYLLAFSLRRNWRRLVAASDGGNEPRLERLKVFHGLRTIITACVISVHAMLSIFASYVANPLYIEKSYEDPLKLILFNGPVVSHTFFVMSSFLLAYKFQLHAEKHAVGWVYLPKKIMLRWLRLTPTYALVLATIATWMRHAYFGPLWDLAVTSEATACRQLWWTQLLYINNYLYDNARCMPQTWYLAADLQLFCLGLLVCVVARKCKTRVIILSLLFMVALLIVAGHTYFQDLDPVLIQSPESYRNLYATDNTFRLMYIRGHTKMSTYILGMACGFLVYHWQDSGKNLDRFKRFKWVVWLTFPLMVVMLLSGGIFYVDGSRVPTTFRILYAIFFKPTFQLLSVVIILSCIFKIESVYRCLVEWRGFVWTGRVSYMAFLLHTVFQRALIGSQAKLTHVTDYKMLLVVVSSISLTYACAVALWLCVEAPAAGLTSAALAPRKPAQETKA